MGKHTRRVVAVIPAHNEQATVGHTVASLQHQTVPPDRVLVVSDNSTDDTVQAAKDAGADTMVTTGNTHKKAGALNQALATLNLTAGDLVLIMDADTIMVPGWIERALVELQDSRVGAVGAVFQADSDRGWLRGCQAREWCQPAGTMVDTPDGQVPIEQVQEGQQVMGFDVKNSALRRGVPVTGTAVRNYTGTLTTLRIGDKSSTYTAEHKCLVRLGDAFENKYLVYMMRRGKSFRIGCTKGTWTSGNHTQFGLGWRIQTEDADEAWVIGVHSDKMDALVHEQVTAYRYGIPMALFRAVRENGNSMGRSELTRLWDEMGDLTPRATRLLTDHNMSINAPLYNRRGTRGTRVAWRKAVIEVPAGSLFDGMLALPLDQAKTVKNKANQVAREAWQPISVTRYQVEDEPVYSLDVAKTHTYFADGVLTHNCRYGVQISRTGKTFVLSGTAALIRWEALQDVRRATGNYYDPSALTEDFAATINLLNAGWLLRSPVECETTTETMGTVPELITQRTRWSRGALQCVTRQGLTRVTRVYWWQQLMLLVAILVGVAAYALTVAGWALYGPRATWYAVLILAIFWLERVVTVWGMGWRHRLVAALMVPELAYAWILQIAHMKAIWQHFTNAAETWHLNDKETLQCSI